MYVCLSNVDDSEVMNLVEHSVGMGASVVADEDKVLSQGLPRVTLKQEERYWLVGCRTLLVKGSIQLDSSLLFAGVSTTVQYCSQGKIC